MYLEYTSNQKATVADGFEFMQVELRPNVTERKYARALSYLITQLRT